MAYRDFRITEFDMPTVATCVAPEARLSALEREVVMLARRDRLSSIRPQSRFGAAMTKLFGLRIPNRLADERLERLRQFAVTTMQTGGARDDEVARLRVSGFSDLQIAEANQIALRYRRSVRFSPAVLLAGAMGAFTWLAAYLLVRIRVEDSMIAAIIVAYLGLPVIASLNAGEDPKRRRR